MIFDNVKNAGCYIGINPQLDIALQFLVSENLLSLDAGKHTISENEVTCSRIEAETRLFEEGFFEAHKLFLDIHVPLTGTELLMVSPIDALLPDGEYDEAGDCQKYHRQKAGMLILTPGTFAVCFAQDGHMPLICENKPERIEKLIFKVRI